MHPPADHYDHSVYGSGNDAKKRHSSNFFGNNGSAFFCNRFGRGNSVSSLFRQKNEEGKRRIKIFKFSLSLTTTNSHLHTKKSGIFSQSRLGMLAWRAKYHRFFGVIKKQKEA
jgi:hypothetical protein